MHIGRTYMIDTTWGDLLRATLLSVKRMAHGRTCYVFDTGATLPIGLTSDQFSVRGL